MTPTKTTAAKRVGRPLKGDGPAFPEAEVDRLLVHGEERPDGSVHFPSFRDLGVRYGVSHSLFAAYSRKHNCLGRRQEAQGQVRAIAHERIVAERGQRDGEQKAALLGMLDGYFTSFAEALRDGRVRTDNIGDFDRACRLKAFLLGDSESRKEVVSGITLEYLQERHREYLEQLANTTPEMTGRIVRAPAGAPIVDAEVVDDDDDDPDA
jgi:hypothetical protein